jgi:hypothetical protein
MYKPRPYSIEGPFTHAHKLANTQKRKFPYFSRDKTHTTHNAKTTQTLTPLFTISRVKANKHNLAYLLEGQANVVEAIHQAVLTESVNLKRHVSAARSALDHLIKE